MARPTRKYGARRPGAAPDPSAYPEAAYLIDSNNYIFRAFHGVPDFSAADDRPTNATYGFIRTLLMLVRERRPAWAAAIFEGAVSFRNELFAEYKQNRVEPPDNLVPQFEDCRRAAAAIGFACLEAEGYEADDLMGSIAVRLRDEGRHVVLVSGDKDLAQLVGERISLYDVARDEEFDREKVIERFGVAPEQIPDLLALIGDAIDNIPGIRGIGDKTAVALLQGFGSLEAILADPDRIETLAIRNARAIKEKIIEAATSARLSHRLATIATDAPMELDLEALRYRGADREAVDDLFDELRFGARIRGEIPLWADAGPLFASAASDEAAAPESPDSPPAPTEKPRTTSAKRARKPSPANEKQDSLF